MPRLQRRRLVSAKVGEQISSLTLQAGNWPKAEMNEGPVVAVDKSNAE
jgi:hypothetical protein